MSIEAILLIVYGSVTLLGYLALGYVSGRTGDPLEDEDWVFMLWPLVILLVPAGCIYCIFRSPVYLGEYMRKRAGRPEGPKAKVISE